jgi:hypothetical protein
VSGIILQLAMMAGVELALAKVEGVEKRVGRRQNSRCTGCQLPRMQKKVRAQIILILPQKPNQCLAKLIFYN